MWHSPFKAAIFCFFLLVVFLRYFTQLLQPLTIKQNMFLLLSPLSPPQWYSCILFFYIQELPFKVVQHIITTVDCQPSGENGVLVFVVGQLKVLNSYVCTAPVVLRGCKDTWLVLPSFMVLEIWSVAQFLPILIRIHVGVIENLESHEI